MAAPRADSYSAPSGTAVHAGRTASGLPSWYVSQTARTWKVVPTANTLMSIDPAARADMNPNFPGGAPWAGAGGFGTILDAWGTIVPNQDDGRLHMPLFGGHGDYAGNCAVDINLMSEAPAYRLVRRPSGALPDAAMNYNDGLDATGTYSDGRIRAVHPYNLFTHIPGGQIFMARVGASYPAGNVTARKCFYIHPDTGEHTLIQDYSAVDGSQGSPEGGTCYDPTRHCVWHIGNSASHRLMKTDLTTGTTSAVGGTNAWVGGASALVYVPGHDLIAMLTNISGGTGLILVNPVNGNANRVAPISGTGPTGWSGSYGYSGCAWVPELGGIAMWDHDSNTVQPALLTPPASNAYSGTWTLSALAVSGSNTVTPTTRISSSIRTYGKFGYLPALGCFYLQNRTSDPLYVFKL